MRTCWNILQITVNGDILYIHERDGYNLDQPRDQSICQWPVISNILRHPAPAIFIVKIRLTVRKPFDIDLSGACDVKMDLKAPAS